MLLAFCSIPHAESHAELQSECNEQWYDFAQARVVLSSPKQSYGTGRLSQRLEVRVLLSLQILDQDLFANGISLACLCKIDENG